MNRYVCWIDGKFVRADQAAISPFDLSVLRGLAVFDYFRVYDGVPFELDRYLSRFCNSVRRAKINLGGRENELASVVHRLIRENGGGSFAVRLLATGGVTDDGFTPPVRGSLLALIEPAKQEVAGPEEGVSLICSEYLRPFPEIKTTCYLNALAERERMVAAGAYETLHTWNGRVLECSKSNFFIFKGDRLITAEDQILHGITRGLVLELADRVFDVEVRPVAVSELGEATEAFLTGTSPKVTPVLRIENNPVGSGKPGANTLKLRRLLLSYFEGYLESHRQDTAA